MSGLFYKVTYPCEKVRDFMYDFLDESLPTLTSIRFHLHLNGCAECRKYLFLYKKAADAKAFRKENPAPDAFLESTLDFLEKEGIVEKENVEGGIGKAAMTRIAALGLAFLTAFPALLPAATAARIPPEPDQSSWQRLLDRYLDTASADGINRFRYGAVTPADKASLDACLGSMQAVKASTLASDAQRAFWINLYNARTVSAVLAAYPIKSIRDIREPGSGSEGPWDAKRLKVEGRDLSLNDIENGILRTRWKDNRIHFALNCASLGCPNLSPRAFTSANLETQLDKGATDYLRSPRGAEFTGSALTLSSLFDWYKADFGENDREMLESISRFAEPGLAARLRRYAGKIGYRYDWDLNGK